MKNFVRALRFAWPYRGRIALSVVAALLAAVLWSLNLTAIYPVLKIFVSGQNLQSWISGSVAELKVQVADWEKQAEELPAKYGALVKEHPEDTAKWTRRLPEEQSKYENKISAAHSSLYWYQKAGEYIDVLFPEDRFETLALVLIWVVIAVAVKGLFEFAQESLVGSVCNLSLFDLRNLFYRKAIHLDVNNFSESGTSELTSRFTIDAETLSTGLKTLFGKVVAEPLKAIGCIVVAMWICWQLTLMFLILVPVALFVITRIGRTMKRATRRVLERTSNIYKILQETFVGIRVVKGFTGETRERRRFHAATLDYYHKAMWVVYLDAATGPIIELLGVAAVGAALLAGGYLVLVRGELVILGISIVDHPMEAETLLQLYALLAAIADPVRKLSSVFTKIQSGAAAADRIYFFMDKEPRVHNNSKGKYLARHEESIEFRDVCFSYDAGHPVLSGVNLTIRHGETIALVGKNGCGKSTLLGMLPRFWDPDHGTVLVDGTDLRNANLRSLRRQIGMVTQDTLLFDDTIYNNIAYGKRRVNRAEVEAAARRAQAHDVILKLHKGYDTRVGEAGTKLSGGQKQRIALARAFLRDPSVLLLDEFTSQTDVETELEVHRILREFMKGRTTFVITHRLNTLEIADRIVVLDAGRILAVGSHGDLVRSCPLYQRLHEALNQKLVA